MNCSVCKFPIFDGGCIACLRKRVYQLEEEQSATKGVEIHFEKPSDQHTHIAMWLDIPRKGDFVQIADDLDNHETMLIQGTVRAVEWFYDEGNGLFVRIILE